MSEIKPALTAEEWDAFQAQVSGCMEDDSWEACVESLAVVGGDAHAMAAKLLHGQSFGFTWEILAAIRACSDFTAEQSIERDGDPDVMLARQGADRIAALLPPREP